MENAKIESKSAIISVALEQLIHPVVNLKSRKRETVIHTYVRTEAREKLGNDNTLTSASLPQTKLFTMKPDTRFSYSEERYRVL
jgi:hypothetical protein